MAPAPEETFSLRKLRRELEDTTRETLPLAAVSPPALDAVLVNVYPPGPSLGNRYTLAAATVTVGRRSDAEVPSDHPSVSRHHARIDRGPDGTYTITDLRSANGTFVNGVRVHAKALHDGDSVQFGHALFRFLSSGNVEAQYHEEIRRLACVDPLTDLPNRRALTEFLDREAARATRHGRPLGVLLIDLDHFKAVNDWLGHLGGDFLLRVVAARLRPHVRGEDLLARYGGEEFAAVLPELGPGDLGVVAERLRAAVADSPFQYGGQSVSLTASVGGAAASGLEPIDPADLLSWADQQLYEAKARGRNLALV